MKQEEQKKALIKFQVKIPEKYRKVYILGSSREMGRWQTYGAKRMKRIGTSQVFEIELEVPFGETVQYKYLHKRDWTGVECGKEYNELKNREIFIEKEYNDYITHGNFHTLNQGIDVVEGFRKMKGDK